MAKGIVKINEEYCKSCGLCVSVCPTKILSIDSEKINSKGYYPVHVINMEKCIACSSCAKICPDVVFEIGKVK
jgi:2-oxoglutarate ferredoxin oxidoreductase subunit delta